MKKKEAAPKEAKTEVVEAEANAIEEKKSSFFERLKAKRTTKLRKKYLESPDIKYQGPLSYRALRIIAWLSMVFVQIAIVISIGRSLNLFDVSDFSGLYFAFNIISSLSTPLFVIASFGLILSGKKSYLSYVIFYGAGFLGIGLALCVLYGRYIEGLFIGLGIHETDVYKVVQTFASNKVQVNVFADLFMFTLFHMFLNYNPPKFFEEKKLLIFRFFALIPVLYVAASYVLKILAGLGIISLSFYFFPFFTTKSPLVFLLFVVVSLLMKYRELIFVRLGATRKEYREFLKTKKNSLAVSVNISVIIAIFSVVEIFILLVLFVYYVGVVHLDYSAFTEVATLYGVGQCVSLILAIPFILLYSYTRLHKNPIIDIIIPVGGIIFIMLVYIEGIYQMIIRLIQM